MALPAAVLGPRMRALGRQEPAQWVLTLCQSAGEGGGCFVSPRQHVYVPAGCAGEPARAAEEAARRARKKLRRYAVANGLNRLGTLTYGPPRCTDPREVREHVGLFFRQLREGLGGQRLPYVWVPELHKDGVHFHVHFAVGRFVRQDLIKTTWGRGFVGIKRIGNMPVGSGRWEQARRNAGYLSKYVSKTFTEPGLRPPGMHRYEVAQGFQPKETRLTGCSVQDVLDQASDLMGSTHVYLWSSAEKEDWQGPPSIWARWD